MASEFAETDRRKDFGIMVDGSMNVSIQCAAAMEIYKIASIVIALYRSMMQPDL